MHKTARLHDTVGAAVLGLFKPEMSDTDFRRFADFFAERLGFEMPPTKRALLAGRLDRRLRELGLDSYANSPASAVCLRTCSTGTACAA